jgi:uncharacterized membrane protein
MDIGVIINSGVAVICLVIALMLPLKMGWSGIFLSHFATLLGFLLMGAVNTSIDEKYYDGFSTLLGLALFAFVFNILVLPVSLTGYFLHKRKNLKSNQLIKYTE